MLASDEGEGQRLCNDLSSMGTAALVYPARDFNFRPPRASPGNMSISGFREWPECWMGITRW